VGRRALLLALLPTAAACDLAPDSSPDAILGSGVIRTISRETAPFDGIEFGSEGRVIVTQTDGISVTIIADGLVDVDAGRLETEPTTVVLSGAGAVTVRAAERFSVDLSRAGSVRYRGDPVLDLSVTGTGTVDALDEG
jgi:hypothetical protein